MNRSPTQFFVVWFCLVCAITGCIVTFWFPIVGLGLVFGAMFMIGVVSMVEDERLEGKLLRGIPIFGGAAMALWYLFICLSYQQYIYDGEMPTNWNMYHMILASLFGLHTLLVATMINANSSQRLVAALAYVTTAWIVVFVIFQYCMGTLFKTCG
jgi:hypothetical protein